MFHSRYEIGDREFAITHMAVLLDPLSEAAQKWASVLDVRPAIIRSGMFLISVVMGPTFPRSVFRSLYQSYAVLRRQWMKGSNQSSVANYLLDTA